MNQKNPQLTIGEYQSNLVKRQRHYSNFQVTPLVIAIGLPGEVGEVCEIIKKHHRDGVLDIEHLKEELSDVLAYLGLIADIYDLTLQEIMEFNEEKLNARIGEP